MSTVLDLARPELRGIRPYVPGAYEPGCIRLNANESPWRVPGDKSERGLNVYPPPRPTVLQEQLAEYYGIEQRQILVTRGSSEAIDVLIRGFCAAGRDEILVCPPTFDMYRFYASIQNAGVVRVPLKAERDFALDTDGILAALDATVKIVFICSPNNPTGQSMARADIERICRETAGARSSSSTRRITSSRGGDFLDLRNRYEHVVLLRTLSKFVVARRRSLRAHRRRARAHRVRPGRAAALHLPDAVDRARRSRRCRRTRCACPTSASTC